MKLPIADALQSKKFLAFLATLIVVIGNKVVGHFGYELDASQVALLVGAAATYMLGQGIADNGKEAAKLNAAAAATMANAGATLVVPTDVVANVLERKPQGGFVRLGLMVVVAMLGAMLLFGCSNQARRDTLGATVAVLDTGDATLHTYAHQHTEDLIHAPGADSVATSAAVAAFRAKVDKIEADIAACYRLVATAGTLSDQQSLDNAVALSKAVLAELIALGVVK